jgi:hypothetical protein
MFFWFVYFADPWFTRDSTYAFRCGSSAGAFAFLFSHGLGSRDGSFRVF